RSARSSKSTYRARSRPAAAPTSSCTSRPRPCCRRFPCSNSSSPVAALLAVAQLLQRKAAAVTFGGLLFQLLDFGLPLFVKFGLPFFQLVGGGLFLLLLGCGNRFAQRPRRLRILLIVVAQLLVALQTPLLRHPKIGRRQLDGPLLQPQRLVVVVVLDEH